MAAAMPGIENQETLRELIGLGVELCQTLAEFLSLAQQLISIALADRLFVFFYGQGCSWGELFPQGSWAWSMGLQKVDGLSQTRAQKLRVSTSGLAPGQLGKILPERRLLRGADMDKALALQSIKQDRLLGLMGDDKNFLKGGYSHL